MKDERDRGRLFGMNTGAAGRFDVKVTKMEDGAARIEWSKIEAIATGLL